MPQTLAQLVRSKYPGAYDDMSDADLEAKVDAKYPGAYDDLPRSTRAPAKDPETFPSPMETAGRMVKSGLNAIPEMAIGMVKGAADPITLPFREASALAQGKNSPTMDQMRQSYAAARSGDYLGAIPTVGPMIQGVVRGGQEIVDPLAKTVVSGAGTVTPEEMNTAADTGGAAITGLAAPELARGGVAVAGRMPGVGKLLKFAPAAVVAASGHPIVAAKMLITKAVKGAVLDALGTVAKDKLLGAAVTGDLEAASSAIATGLEQSPRAAQEFAKAMEAEANRVAGSGPKMQPFRPIGNSPADVAARNATKATERANAPTPGPIVAPEAPQARQMPVSGNVKPATVYTKPGPKVKPPAGESETAKALAEKQKTVASPDAIRAAFETKPKGATPHSTKGPSGRPLTAAERMEALKELQRAVAADEDIFQAFGLTGQ